MDGLTVGKDGAHGKGIQHPALQGVVIKHLRVVYVVSVTILGITLYYHSEHVQDGITMAVESRAGKGIAVGHFIILPLVVDLFESHPSIPAKRVHQPDILGENEGWFHVVNRFALVYNRGNLALSTKITQIVSFSGTAGDIKVKKPNVLWRSSSGKRRDVRPKRPVSNTLHPAWLSEAESTANTRSLTEAPLIKDLFL